MNHYYTIVIYKQLLIILTSYCMFLGAFVTLFLGLCITFLCLVITFLVLRNPFYGPCYHVFDLYLRLKLFTSRLDSKMKITNSFVGMSGLLHGNDRKNIDISRDTLYLDAFEALHPSRTPISLFQKKTWITYKIY